DRITIQEIRESDQAWNEIVEANVECFAVNDTPDYRKYAERRIADHRSLVAKGIGKWFTARADGEFAGSLGIFRGDGLCRFQEVAVRQKFRRQGIAATLVYTAAAWAQRTYPGYPAIIVAASKGDAISVYHSVGFQKHSDSYALSERD